MMITEQDILIGKEPPEDDGKVNAYSEDEVVKDLKKKLYRSRRWRDEELGLADKWRRYRQFYAGDQWSSTMPDWVPRVGPNLCKMFVEVNAAILTRSRPEYTVRALSEQAEDLAAIIDETMHFLWDTRGFLIPVQMAIKGAGIYGSGFVKVRWNEEDDDITWEYAPAFNIFPDPLAGNLENCRWLIQVSLDYKKDLELRYGVELSDAAIVEEATEKTEGRKPEAGVMRVLECWMDRGRVKIVMAGDKILEYQEENPMQTFPYGRIVDSEVENAFFPGGIVADILPSQREVNERRAQIHAWAKFNAWNKWLATPDIDMRALQSNMPNTVVWGDPGSVSPLLPAPMPEYLLASPSLLLKEMEVVTGIQDISQGRRPPQIQAGVAIERLLEASQVRIESKTISFEKALSRLGELTLSLIKANYTDDRILPFLDEDQIDVFQQLGGMRGILDASMLIRVQPGSTLSQSQGAMVQLARDLFINKAIDSEALLDTANFPGRKRILMRMGQKIPGYDGISIGQQGASLGGGQMTNVPSAPGGPAQAPQAPQAQKGAPGEPSMQQLMARRQELVQKMRMAQ